jgi:hypothetical protein
MTIKAEGSRVEVMHGKARHTSGGLTKNNLKYDGDRIISKKQQAAGKKNPALKKWSKAFATAKKEMGIPKGEFALAKGKLLTKTRAIYKKK